MKIILIIFIILICIIYLISMGLMCFVIYPKKPTYEEALKIETDKGFMDQFDSWNVETMDLTMEDGYLIHGQYIRNDNPTNRYVIITHGYSYNSRGSIKYAKVFYKLGFNIYIYDLRGFGNNKDVICTMGYKEHKDLVTIVHLMKEKFGQDIILGLHGESLGAASSILALGKLTDIDFCVADCPFSDCGLLFNQVAKAWFKLPAFMVRVPSFLAKINHGFTFDSIRPIDSFTKNTKTPICFIHGADDDFILPMHSKRMYDVAKNPKEIHLVAGAKHAQSYETAPDAYFNIVQDFIKQYL